jgi:hypothetical protein
MELLFDRDEREEAIPDDLFPGASPRGERAAAGGGTDELSVKDKTPAPDTKPDAELSVDALLKRFGIK